MIISNELRVVKHIRVKAMELEKGEYLSAVKIARELDVSPATVHRYIKRHNLGHHFKKRNNNIKNFESKVETPPGKDKLNWKKLKEQWEIYKSQNEFWNVLTFAVIHMGVTKETFRNWTQRPYLTPEQQGIFARMFAEAEQNALNKLHYISGTSHSESEKGSSSSTKLSTSGVALALLKNNHGYMEEKDKQSLDIRRKQLKLKEKEIELARKREKEIKNEVINPLTKMLEEYSSTKIEIEDYEEEEN